MTIGRFKAMGTVSRKQCTGGTHKNQLDLRT